MSDHQVSHSQCCATCPHREESGPPPQYREQTDAEMASCKPLKVSNPEDLTALWEALIHHLNYPLGTVWMSKHLVAGLFRRRIPKEERGNASNFNYLECARLVLDCPSNRTKEILDVLREGRNCYYHCRTSCYCMGFAFEKTVHYYNWKTHFEEQRMEFF